ncbi:MAG: tetratricopeptide repeat protein [Armatimonadota bacterium]
MKNNNWIYLKITAFLAFLVIVVKECLYYIAPGDLWWQLADGKYMVLNHVISKTEVFSFSAPGFPWLNHEWLAEIVFYLVYKINGLAALNVFKIIIVVAAFIILFKICSMRKALFFPAVLAVVLAALFAEGSKFFGVRPYLFTYIFGTLYLLCLCGYRSSRKVLWLFIASGVMLLWVNFHGSFTFGFVLAGVFVLEEFVNMLRKKDSLFAPLGIFFAVNLLITLFNPWGYQIWHVLLFIKDKVTASTIIEWQPPEIFAEQIAYFIYLCFVNILFFIKRKKRISDFLLLVILDYLSLSSIRYMAVFSLFTSPILAVSMQDLIERFKLLNLSRLKALEKPLALTGIIILVIYSFFMFRGVRFDELSVEWEMFPKEAVLFLQANELPPNIFNAYEWGGYLAFNLYPQYKIYIDGRVNFAYPIKVYTDYLNITACSKDWQKLLDEYNAEIIMTAKIKERINPVFNYSIKNSKNWEKIYEDEVCIIYIKTELLNKISRIRYPLSYYICVTAGEDAFRKGEYKKAEKLFKKALEIYPRSTRAMINLGTVLCMQGKEDEGVELFKEAVIIGPLADIVHYNLGRYYIQNGDLKKAKKEFLKELKVNPGYEPAIRELEKLETVK